MQRPQLLLVVAALVALGCFSIWSSAFSLGGHSKAAIPGLADRKLVLRMDTLLKAAAPHPVRACMCIGLCVATTFGTYVPAREACRP